MKGEAACKRSMRKATEAVPYWKRERSSALSLVHLPIECMKRNSEVARLCQSTHTDSLSEERLKRALYSLRLQLQKEAARRTHEEREGI